MKREKTIVDSRREQIIEQLLSNPDITAQQLADLLDVSCLTIRRDFQYLEENKKITRFYGGARVITAEDSGIERKSILHKIAKHGASFVEDGDIIFINSSYTAILLIQYIEAKNVTVITNNGKAIGIDHPTGVKVILTGGELREIKEAMVGDFVINNLSRVTAKKCFLGCSGLTAESGMTSENSNEVNINEMMSRRCVGETYILASNDKIGRTSSFISCPIDNIQNVITNKCDDESKLESFINLGVKVHEV